MILGFDTVGERAENYKITKLQNYKRPGFHTIISVGGLSDVFSNGIGFDIAGDARITMCRTTLQYNSM